MGSDWLDELLGESAASGEDQQDAFYCPYTNTAECALLSKGWQPQELCDALECDQLKLTRHAHRHRDRAA